MPGPRLRRTCTDTRFESRVVWFRFQLISQSTGVWGVHPAAYSVVLVAQGRVESATGTRHRFTLHAPVTSTPRTLFGT